MPALGAWDTVVSDTWDNQTEKWDLVNYLLTGTFNAECELKSAVVFGLVVAGNLDISVDLNSPPEFPVIEMVGDLSLSVILEAKVDYSLWVGETPITSGWVAEEPS